MEFIEKHLNTFFIVGGVVLVVWFLKSELDKLSLGFNDKPYPYN